MVKRGKKRAVKVKKMKPRKETMMGNRHASRRVIAIVITAVLAVLSFLIIKPYIAALLFGIVLAFIFFKPYKLLNKLIKKSTISSLIICLLVIAVLALGVYFIAQITVREAFNLYMSIQKLDIFDLVNKAILTIFPDSPELARQITLTLQQGLVSLTNSFINQVGQFMTNAPQFFIQLFITFFVMFYFLKEGKSILKYVREILPFSSEVNEKLIKRSQDVAHATIYGQIIIGIIQGITAGIGFYIFGAPSPLFFTILATLLSILPFVGSWLVWFPLGLIMIAAGDVTSGILMMVFGFVIVSTIDDIVKPFIVGKRARINPLIVLIGMLGGLVMIGPIGLIVGPIILEYLLIFMELYRTGKIKLAI
ncbi:MAG: AI-2E family transporter [Candidatus Pacearchaeota archaeon]|nr:MAG: AI-2E family transporter [Candidatus Pacearchaeota archaeon]